MKSPLQSIEKLEQRVAEFIKMVETMNHDNEILRNDQRILRQEFKALQEKNKIARGRVEQIVARLKSLESWLRVNVASRYFVGSRQLPFIDVVDILSVNAQIWFVNAKFRRLKPVAEKSWTLYVQQ